MRATVAVPVLVALAASAPAADVETSILTVKEGGAADTVAWSGTIADAAAIAPGASLTVQCGAFRQTLEGFQIERKKKSLSFTAPKGSTGITKFTLKLKKGAFTLSAAGVEVGDLAKDVALSLEIDGRRSTLLHPLAGKPARRTWKKGGAVHAKLALRVLRVSSAQGNAVLAPGVGQVFAGADPASAVKPVGAVPTVGADGILRVTLETTDPDALDRLDLGAILGTPSGSTRPGEARITAGDDGEVDAVVLVEPAAGNARTIAPNAATTFTVDGADGAPSGTLTVPSGAVTASLAGVRFTPLTLAAQLPAGLPAGYVAIAGAEISSAAPASFVAASAPTMALSRPRWAERDALASADIRLLAYGEGGWTVAAGRGAYDPVTDRIGPDPAEPARIPATGFVAYAASSPGAKAEGSSARVRGQVVDEDGDPLPGHVVLTRNGAVVADAAGGYELPASTLGAESLEVVQSIGGGTSTARVVSAVEAAEPVEIRAAAAVQPDVKNGIVTVTALEAGGTTPSPGAKVTIRVRSALRGLTLDDGGTSDQYGDDILAVPDLSDLGVTQFTWTLSIPGDPVPFASAERGNAVTPALLYLEAQDAGRSPDAGAYTLRCGYSVPTLGDVSLYAGFRMTLDGFVLSVTDVQLPAGVEGAPVVSLTAGQFGTVQPILQAAVGLPMSVTAVRADGTKTASEDFQFATTVRVDLAFPLDPPPAIPPGLAYGWNLRAPMPTYAFGHEAAVLGGKLYLLGGDQDNVARLRSYDPMTDVWADLAPATLPRGGGGRVMGFAAAAGRLYAVGGADFPQGGAQRSVESYDPVAETWSTRSSMAFRRGGAAVCASGSKVYAFGGANQEIAGILQSSVEVLDTATDTWTSGPAMPTVLGTEIGGGAAPAAGRIFVIGRDERDLPPGPLHALSLDLATSIWSSIELPPVAGFAPSVCTLNGQVFVTNAENGSSVTDFAVYDPVAGIWGAVPSLPGGRVMPAMAEIDGIVYFTGGNGYVTGGLLWTEVWAYRPAWVPEPQMPTARSRAAAAAAKGLVYVTGGRSGPVSLATVEVFDPASDWWRTKAPMNAAREDHGLAAVNGTLYAVGGFDRASGAALASVESYSAGLNRWTTLAPMSRARRGPAVFVHDGRLFVAGGGDASVEAYDPLTNTWSARSPMPAALSGAAAAVLGGAACVFGGESSGAPVATTFAYDPALDSWSARGALAAPRRNAGGVALDGRIYALGGSDGSALSSVEVFAPSPNAWNAAPPLQYGRDGAACAELDGVIYVFGGASPAGVALSTGVSYDPD